MSVLSISRQFGAGGKTLGETVAQRLGLQLVDEAIVDKVAEEAKVSVAWVESVASEAGGRLMRFLATLVPSSFMQRHLGEAASDFDEIKYKEFLERVIREVAKEGNAVILGRTSQFILQDDPNVIKVLLVAERPDRIKFMMERYNLEKDKALAMITREERKRARFLHLFHEGDPNDPSFYHMVINTSLIPIQVAALQICDLVLDSVDHTARPIW